MNWSDIIMYNISYKKFDITDASRSSDTLKRFPEDEKATEDVAMYRYFETVIGGTVNLYVNIDVKLSASSSRKLTHTISVRDKDNNVVAEAILTTTGDDSEYTTIKIPVTALNKYTISTICSDEAYQGNVTISSMVLYGKIVDDTSWYIF